nr:hypothetical protein Iba_chr13fCG5390 [Ipomoea batatas]
MRLQKIAIGEDRRFRRLSQLEKIAIGAWRYGVILGELWCISSCYYGLELSDIMMCIGAFCYTLWCFYAGMDL